MRLNEVALKHARYYLQVIKQAQALWTKGPDTTFQALSLFGAEWPNIERAHAWLRINVKTIQPAGELISLYAIYAAEILQRSFSPQTQIQWLEPAFTHAQTSQDQSRLGEHLNNLALAYAAAGNRQLAIMMYERRIQLARSVDDVIGEGAAQCNLGVLFKDSGRLTDALKCMERSLELDRSIGNKARECESLASIGAVYQTAGDARRAVHHYEEAAAIMSSNEFHTQGAILGNLASCWKILGERERAKKIYLQRIDLARGCGDLRGLALALANFGLFLSDDDPQTGAAACREAIQLKVDEPRIRGNILNNYGVVLRRAGKLDEAATAFEEALALSERAGDMVLKIGTLGHFGFLMAQRGEAVQAAELYERQLILARGAGLKRQQAWALDQLSSYYFDLGRLGQAIQCLRDALELRQELQDTETADQLKVRLDDWVKGIATT